ncbi:carboxypeptidase-like regulatory domain-containing protein [Saccharicrinis sp. FJH54]|uniref:carboxypeptidase-like regulatory domain-containing protein n=1 Tax=Saccharicrinis sp. FJH54 TaxID=3344665 RepID=UPI0035D51005
MRTCYFYLLTFILIGATFKVKAQHNYLIQGVLTDTLNNPIEYANIGIFDQNIGTVSDVNGNFQLFVPAEFLEDSITFSSIGFYTMRISIKQLVNNDSAMVCLIPKIERIKEIKVIAKPYKVKIRGAKTDTKKIILAVTGDTSSLGIENGTVINLPNKSPVKIKDVNFNIASNYLDSAKFRLKIYTYSKNEIKECLLKENIYFSITKMDTGNYKVDLSNYNIFASNAVLVSIENIALYSANTDNDRRFWDRINISGTLLTKGYRRKTSLGNWEKIPYSFAPGIWVTILKFK